MLFTPLLALGLTVSSASAGYLVRRDDKSYKATLEILDEFDAALAATLNEGAECWYEDAEETDRSKIPEVCHKQLDLFEGIMKSILSGHAPDEDVEVVDLDVAVRGLCMHFTSAEMRKATVECSRHYCKEGTDGATAFDVIMEKQFGLGKELCPKLVEQYQKVVTEGYNYRKGFINRLTTTIDGKETIITSKTTGTETATQTPIILPEDAFAFTTQFTESSDEPTETTSSGQPEKTESPSNTRTTEPENDSSGTAPAKTDEPEPEPENGAAGRGVGAGVFVAVILSIAWAAFGY